MSIPADCAISIGTETTFGTYAAADRSLEFVSESLDVDKQPIQSSGLRSGGRLARASRRVVASKDAVGDIEIEVTSKGMGELLAACFGSGTSTQIGSTDAYQQLFRFGDTPDSLSVQKLIVDEDGTVVPFTFLGCMVDKWELTCDNGDLVKLKVTFVGKGIDTAQSAESVTYVTNANLFHFAQGTIELNGTLTVPTTTALASMTGETSVGVRSFSISVDNKLAKRRNFGNGGAIAKPRVGQREAKAKMTIEFDSTTFSTAYLNDASMACLLSFDTGVEIADSDTNEALQVAIPVMKLNGEVPKANGGELVTMDVECDILDGLSATYPLYAVLRTADTAL